VEIMTLSVMIEIHKVVARSESDTRRTVCTEPKTLSRKCGGRFDQHIHSSLVITMQWVQTRM
jgi:hypothetical protein